MNTRQSYTILFQKTGWFSSLMFITAVTFLIFSDFIAPIASTDSQPVENKEVIAVSQFPLTDWCMRIAPEGTTIISLCQFEYPHSSILRKDYRQEKLRPRVIIKTGFCLEPFIPTIETTTPETRILNLSESNTAFTQMEESSAGASLSAPCLWLDPVWSQDAIRQIADTFKEIWPEKASEIEQRTQDYLFEVHQMHTDCSGILQSLPNKEFVGENGYFTSFLDVFGLKQIATLQMNPCREYSIKQYRDMVNQLLNLPHPIILTGSWQKKQFRNNLQSQTHSIIIPMEIFGNPAYPESNTYIGMMRHNVSIIQLETQQNHG